MTETMNTTNYLLNHHVLSGSVYQCVYSLILHIPNVYIHLFPKTINKFTSQYITLINHTLVSQHPTFGPRCNARFPEPTVMSSYQCHRMYHPKIRSVIVDRITSITVHRTTPSITVHRTTLSITVHRTTTSVTVHRTTTTVTVRRATMPVTVDRTTTSATVHRTTSSVTLHRNTTSATVRRTTTSVTVDRTTTSATVHRTTSSVTLHRNTTSATVHRTKLLAIVFTIQHPRYFLIFRRTIVCRLFLFLLK